MRIILLFWFLSITCFGSAQSYDTLLTEYDSLYGEPNYEYQEEEEDSLYAKATYTHKPGELPLRQQEQHNQYNKKKFSKTAWKEIIGDTNYTEEKVEPQPQQDTRRSMAWNPAILKIIGFFIIIALVIVLLVYLLRIALADDPTLKKITSDSLLAGDQHIDDIGENDLERMLQDALTRKDLRAAIRIYYIKLLKHLNTTGYIAWKKNKTNRDYASELSSSSFIRDFRKVMVAYEIIWYGERTPSLREFETLQVSFNELHRQSPDQPHEK